MSATQDKVVAKIKTLASAAGVDADFEWGFSNVGRVYFREGFATRASATLDFQNSYMTASVARGDKVSGYFGDNDGIAYVHYNKADEFDQLFALIATVLRPMGSAEKHGLLKPRKK